MPFMYSPISEKYAKHTTEAETQGSRIGTQNVSRAGRAHGSKWAQPDFGKNSHSFARPPGPISGSGGHTLDDAIHVLSSL